MYPNLRFWVHVYIFAAVKYNTMYYKKLGISEEDVVNEPDIEKVKEWKRTIDADLADFKARTSGYSVMTPGQRHMKAVLEAFSTLCYKRIGDHNIELKEQGLWKTHKARKQERVFSVAFQQVAKEHLDKETYDRLVALTNEKINESLEKE